MKQVRQKKFIGAVIGAVGQVAGMIGNAVKAKKEAEAAQEKYKKEQTQVNLQSAIENKQAIQQELQNQDYVNAMKSKVEFKCGGSYKNRTKTKSKTKNKRCKKELGTQEFKCGGTKTKLKCGGTKKCEYGNRTEYACGGTKKAACGTKKEMGCGGKKKMACGGTKKAALGDVIGGTGNAISGVASLISGLAYKPKDYTVQTPETIQANATKIIQPVNVQQPQTYTNNQLQMQARCGKKLKVKSKKC